METGPGQGDPLFPWLRDEASMDEFRWFFEQEAAGEAGFPDPRHMYRARRGNSIRRGG